MNYLYIIISIPFYLIGMLFGAVGMLSNAIAEYIYEVVDKNNDTYLDYDEDDVYYD